MVVALIIACVAYSFPLPALADGRPTAGVIAQEVRTVWTGEAGVVHPAGVAYDSGRGELLVVGEDPAGDVVLSLGADEEPVGSFRIPDDFDAGTLVYDAERDVLTSTVSGGVMEASSEALRRGDLTRRERSIAGLAGKEAADAAIDAETGTWFALVDGTVLVTLRGGRSLSAFAAGQDVTHIAFHPTEGRLYELAGSTLWAVDTTGRVTDEYDLSALDLPHPTGIVFAPSTDPTDPEENHNLFVAVSGASSSGGITEVSLASVTAASAPVVDGTLVRMTATSAWSPGSPDPSGVTYLRGADELLVVDSEVDEVTGAGWHDVNLWRARRDGSQVAVGTLWGSTAAVFAGKRGFSREPTGAGFDPISDTLFVSDDSARKVFVIRRGTDGRFGTADDVVSAIDAAAVGSTDTEDPEFDPVTGHLFFLDGVGMEVFRVDPVDGVFGNGNDTITHFDISHLGPRDFEGLASDPARGTLYVAARTTKQIFEITKSGALVRTISCTGVSQLRYMSGLAVAPASDGSGRNHFWIVDRAVDNGADANENDGRLFEVADPSATGPTNRAPIAGDDSASTAMNSPVDITVLANDSDPDGDALVVQIASQPANGTVTVGSDQVARFVPAQNFSGSTSFTYRAFDGAAVSNLATVSVTVTSSNGAPVARNDSVTTSEDTPVDITVLANDTDPDGDALVVQIVSQPANGTVTVGSDQVVRFVPAQDFSGSTSFTYRAFDGAAVSNLATVSVTVSPVNDPPVARPDSVTTGVGVAVVIDVLANDSDVDGDVLAVGSITQPSSGTATVVAGGVHYVPASGFSGTDTFTYQATDGVVLSAPGTVTITVRDAVTTESLATSEQTTRGSVVAGDFTATYSNDDIREGIQEEGYAGNKKTRLEHLWTFQVAPATAADIVIRAHTTGEPFDFAYSVNGSTWIHLARVSATTESLSVVSLPAGMSGILRVRVMDTNSSGKGDSFRDTLSVDQIVIRSVS